MPGWRGLRSWPERLSEVPGLCEVGLPSQQATTALLRQCLLQKFAHLLRTLPPHVTAGFARGLEESAAWAFERALSLSVLRGLQREALFEPVADGGMGLQPVADTAVAAFVGGRAAPAAGPEEERVIRGGRRDGGTFTSFRFVV